MNDGRHPAIFPIALFVLCATILPLPLFAQEFVDFDSTTWNLQNARIVETAGRPAITGFALLKDVEFTDGVIEVDISAPGPASGVRSYPGIVFRVGDSGNYERIYFRPHRAPLYADALQYTPVLNRLAGWQLYAGEGFTAAAPAFPEDGWVRMKLEVSGSGARIFLDDAEEPALVIPHLKSGSSSGSIGVLDDSGRASFSNFAYRTGGAVSIEPAAPEKTPFGTITDWEISQSFTMPEIDVALHPDEQDLPAIEWTAVECDATGLLDIARFRGRSGRTPEGVYAKTTIHADEDGYREIELGYSDAVSVFANGQILFSANSAYRSRDSSFLGILGLNDSIFLPVKKGENELMILVIETFGGWGLLCKDAQAVYRSAGVEKGWETDARFRTPESVIHDPARKQYYISNFDVYNQVPGAGAQWLSTVTPDGETDADRWIEGLNNPTGMILHDGDLYVVERTGVARIDPDRREIVKRVPVPEPGFPNDIAIDRSGRIYVTDSRKSVIYRIAGDEAETWIAGGEVGDPNGALVDGNELLWVNNEDSALKSVDLDTKEVRVIARLEGGILDGLRPDGRGNYLVSHFEGMLYRVTPGGEVTKLLDTTAPRVYCADFEYVPDGGVVIVPAFYNNKLAEYRIR